MATGISDKLKQLNQSGFFNIFGATVINSLVSFVYGIFLVRIMPQSDYGIFSYTQNITNFAVMFCSLGANLGMLQFCSENVGREQKYSYCNFALRLGTVGSIFITLLMIGYSFIDRSGIASLTKYILIFAALPILFFLKEWVTFNLRWQLRNREYGNVMNVHSVANAGFAMLGAWLGGITGVILGIYIAYACSILLGLYYLKGDLKNIRSAEGLDRDVFSKFMKYSVTMCIVNAMISVLFTVDLFVIGNIVKDETAVAMYRTASLIPFALNMVPNSIMTFVYPHVAMHRTDRDWLKKSIRLLYVLNGALNILIGMVLYTGAPLWISMFFGNTYSDILPVFRLLVLSYIVSACLRTPAANLFGILRRTKTAFAISAGTVLLSVCLSTFLVGRFGIIGAAYSSVGTFGTVGVVSLLILIYEIYWKKESAAPGGADGK